ncbi:MAG TPA: peptidoglycan-binding protein, partial [Ideonella sp.]|nr:peptidoglycan-binding protein [Ideonella sp.]
MKLHPVAAAALLAVCLGSPQIAEAAEAPRESSLPYTIQPRDTLIHLGRTVLVSPAAWREVARFNRLH